MGQLPDDKAEQIAFGTSCFQKLLDFGRGHEVGSVMCDLELQLGNRVGLHSHLGSGFKSLRFRVYV